MTDEPQELVASTADENALDALATLAWYVPGVGPVIAQILTGQSGKRKMQRIRESLDALRADIDVFRGAIRDEYVRSADFEDLCERTLRAIFDERNAEKRALLRRFLLGAMLEGAASASEFDTQFEIERMLEELGTSHVQVLNAMLQQPDASRLDGMGSPMQTLRRRLPAYSEQEIEDLIADLNTRRVIRLDSIRTTMTGMGAEDLRHAVMARGQKLVGYLSAGGR